jgi:cytochrome P450
MSAAPAWVGRGLTKAQPWLLRRGERVWRVLRRVRPVLRVGRAVVLTRHDDVRAVLERDDAFSVTYGERMERVTGPFILGWDDGPQYRAEVAALRAAVRPADLAGVAALTRERAAATLAAGGAHDVVVLADEAVGAGLDAYFGLPEVAGRAQREAARDVFRAVFLDGDTPEVMAAGQRGSAALVAAIEGAMSRARSGGGDTVLARLLAAQDSGGPSLPDDAIPRNLVGLVAAWAASVPRAFALAFDVLLDHPPELDRAAALAAAGDERAVGTLMLEALRLQPQAPFLVRACREEVVVAPGAAREQRIRPGDVVFAVTMSAMRDRHTLSAPEGLDPHRAHGDLLHFGAGIHRCFGAAISTAQFGALASTLLRDGRSVHRAGELAWGPAFPASLPVTLAAR